MNVMFLASFVLTMIFESPAVFIWPVLISALALLLAAVTYTYYERNSATGSASDLEVKAVDSQVHPQPDLHASASADTHVLLAQQHANSSDDSSY